MNEICLHCHLLYFSSIILSFEHCAFTGENGESRNATFSERTDFGDGEAKIVDIQRIFQGN
jgi:hypothetical protein